MLTAKELRTQQNNFANSTEVTKYLETTRQNAVEFANTILNEELTKKANTIGNSISWLFKTHDYHSDHLMNVVAREKRALPVKEKIASTNAHRLEGIIGFWYGIDLDVLKEYLEQHGYHVTIKACALEHESYSRKTKEVYQGFKMVITWEE